MTSSQETTRDMAQDRYLTFSCSQFSRGARAGRPMSRRWVSADQCLCTHDEQGICDPRQRYNMRFYETSDDEEVRNRQQLFEQYPHISADRIGVFDPSGGTNLIYVSSHFLDLLWITAVGAGGVLRSISLSVQPQDNELWAVVEAILHEEITEPVRPPQASQPRTGDPELRGRRTLLTRLAYATIAAMAAGLLVAFWMANLTHSLIRFN